MMWQALLVAISFLMRVPVRRSVVADERAVAYSLLFYPLVGLLVGASAWVIATLLPTGSDAVRAAVLLMVWVALTGGLHLDGLADSADALIGSHGDAARALDIMKDPASGPVGVSALVLVLQLKFAALTALVGGAASWRIVCAPLLGRAAVIALFLTTRYVRRTGSGAALARYLPRGPSILALSLSATAAIAAAGPAPVLAAVAVFVVMRCAMRRLLGGTTGDTAGALVEVVEAAVLLAMTLCIHAVGSAATSGGR